MRRFLGSVQILAVMLGCFGGACLADDGTREAEAPAAKLDVDARAKPGDAKEPKPEKIVLDPELSRELRDLIYGPDKPKADDPFESAIQGMRSAKEKMAGRDTGKSTRDIQKKVIEDLEKLIEQAKNQKPPPQSSSGNPDKKPQGNPDQKPMPQSGDKPEDKPNAGEGGETKPDKARDSSDENRMNREREAELARRRDVIKDVWGHLPPALRQKLLNIAGEKSVPKYDELIRRYFESLAEEERR